MARWRNLFKGVGTATAMTLIAVAFGVLDPMGLDGAADRHSAAVIDRILAPRYGERVVGPDRIPPSRLIGVIEVSDSTLERYALEWPPKRWVYSQLLRNLAPPPQGRRANDQSRPGAWPAAIFFDYAFVSAGEPADQQGFVAELRRVAAYDRWKGQPGCYTSALAKIRCIRLAGGTPVMIGKGYPPNSCRPGVRTELTEDLIAQAGPAVVVPMGWPDLPTRFQPYLSRDTYTEAMLSAFGPEDAAEQMEVCLHINGIPADGEPAEAPVYWWPLGQPDNPARSVEVEVDGRPETARDVGSGPKAGYDLSPALAMAYALCPSRVEQPELCRALDRAALTGAAPVFPFEGGASPQWGSRSDPENLNLRRRLYGETLAYQQPCRKEGGGVGRMIQVGLIQLKSGLGADAAAAPVPCPYHLTVDAADVLTPTEAAAQTDFARHQEVLSRLAGRAVAIGAAQSLSNDWIATTLSARRPGVHYHAMTLDNLLEHGLRLRTPPPTAIGFLDLDQGDLLELLCMFVIALIVEKTRLRIAATGPLEGGGMSAPSLLRRLAGIRYILSGQGVDDLSITPGEKASRHFALASGAIGWSLAIMAVAMAYTFQRNWEPVNIVGIFGFTLFATVTSFWSLEGVLMTFGLFATAVLTLVSNLAGRLGKRGAAIEKRAEALLETFESEEAEQPAPAAAPPKPAAKSRKTVASKGKVGEPRSSNPEKREKPK